MSMLSLEQAPPVAAPFRFFFTAPFYGAAAGVLLAVRADTVLLTRWAPDTLAVVHLLVLGFMLQVMAGAMLQFMPVAAGAPVWRPLWTAGLTHAGLNLGTLLLVAGFLGAGPGYFRGAAVVLLATVLGFLAVLAVGLVRSPAIGPTLLALRLAVAGLAVTVSLGFTLAGAMGWGWGLPLVQLTQVHAAWGLLGWSLCLVTGVAGLVVPMFQLTPAYPVAFARAVPLALVAGLLCWSVGVPWDVAPLAWAGALAAAAATVAFAVQTLRLQGQRKRRVLDTTFWSWRIGMVCLAGAAAVGLWLQAGAPDALRGKLEYLVGVLLLGGAFPAVIGGMLYKIVPFLVWLHLSRVMRSPPNMHQVLAEKWPRWQLRLFGAALACLQLGVVWPPFTVAGGGLFAASCLALGVNLALALRVYRQCMAAVRAGTVTAPASTSH